MVTLRTLYAVLGCTFIGLVAPGSTALAQDGELAGTWVLDVAESDFGNVRAPDSAMLVVRRADSTLEMTATQDYPRDEGMRSTDIELPTDGSRQSMETPRGTMLISAEWDGDVLVIWRRTQANVGDIEITERHSLDDAGNRLEVAQSIEIPGRPDVFEATLVYERVDG